MREFPKLEGQQVALMRVDKSTGIVLDDQFKRATSNEQVIFTIFEEIADARGYIESVKNERIDVELVIYDKNEQILEHINK